MKREKLSLKWKNIFSVERKEGYKALRLSSKSLSELYIALDENSNRCLLLFLPKGVNIKLKGIDREKILISFISSKGVIYVKLKDSDYTDLFDDLILSIYSKISLISNFKAASDEFIKIFYKWALFFELPTGTEVDDVLTIMETLAGLVMIKRDEEESEDENKIGFLK